MHVTLSDVVKKGSLAASAICRWIHSVYQYAEIYRQIAPKLARLMEAEADVTKVRYFTPRDSICGWISETVGYRLGESKHTFIVYFSKLYISCFLTRVMDYKRKSTSYFPDLMNT